VGNGLVLVALRDVTIVRLMNWLTHCSTPLLASTESSHLLRDIGACIVAATALAYVARLLRQPLLLAYIAAGVVIGPLGLKWVSDIESIQTLAELGLAFLLFIVGLEIDLTRLSETGKKALLPTIVQVGVSGLLGWLIALAAGYHGLPAIYLGSAVAFSSTMIVLKLLADRNEMQSAAGQMTLGVLLLQDVAAILVLAIQPSLGGALPVSKVVMTTINGLAMVGGAIIATRYILPKMFRFVHKSPEVILLSSLSWCFVVCYTAVKLDFSIAMGAMIAGASISAFPYSLEVVSKVRGLRDFFVPLFFVSLGMLLTVPTRGVLATVLVFAVVTIVSRFVSIWPMVRVGGYDHRTGVLSSIHLSQTSEFSLMLALIGMQFVPAHIDKDVVSIVVLLMIVSSTLSTYMIQYSQPLAQRFVPKAKQQQGDTNMSTVIAPEGGGPAPIMLIGCYRVGSSLVHELRQATIEFSVIDFNQDVNNRLNALGVPTTYGDISHMDTLEHAGVDKARILIAAIGDDFLRGTDNLKLLQVLRKVNPTAKIIVTSESIERALQLYNAGADYVLINRTLAARHLMEVISEIGAGELPNRREFEIEDLRRRIEVVV
jgi:Kef-type K+ transport system membrane component KefB/voltage-gated potassium channel Kch